MHNLQSENMNNVVEVILLVILCASIHCRGCVLVLVLVKWSMYICKASFEKVQLEQSEEFEGNEGSEPW